jgi:cell fate regulator YaaT (PSP1 superfamily)
VIKVVGVRFKDAGKMYYFSPGNLHIKHDDHVIVETSRGLEYGKASTDIIEEREENLVLPLKGVNRIATDKDIRHYHKNLEDAKKAMAICKDKIAHHKLKMQLIDTEYTFHREQLIFYFVAENRVDFRELVKDLANQFKTRIELRQVGVRDEAKVIGGIGPCGYELCCSKFLGDFASVSINMAKNQNLSLNPTKISGLCGRLLCCLTYENSTYKYLRKGMPDLGKRFKTEQGEGKVVSMDVFKRKFVVDVKGTGYIEVQLPPREEE